MAVTPSVSEAEGYAGTNVDTREIVYWTLGRKERRERKLWNLTTTASHVTAPTSSSSIRL